jgi:hypothetical protein
MPLRETATRVWRVGVGIAAAILVVGCFAYRPSESSRVRMGDVVRVSVTPQGAEQLTRQVGPRVASLGGRVIQPRDTALVVAVSEVTRSRGTEEFWTGDSVSVPLSGVGGVSVRRFDRNRTLLTVTGAVIGIVLMRRVIDDAAIFGARVRQQPGSQ